MVQTRKRRRVDRGKSGRPVAGELTQQQLELLEFIAKYAAEHGHAPSLADAAKALRKSTATVHGLLVCLVRLGYVKHQTGTARTMTVMPEKAKPHLFLATARRMLVENDDSAVANQLRAAYELWSASTALV